MKRFYLPVFIIILCAKGVAQPKVLSSEEALSRYEAISASMTKSFPEDNIKTYRRTSFTEQQLETYLSQHYQRLDLLPFIKGHHAFKLQSYLHSGNWFKEIGFPQASIASYKDFLLYYNANASHLTLDEAKALVPLRAYAYDILAANYAKLSFLDSAAITHKINIKFIEQYNIVSYPSSLNNYGLFLYTYKKDLDSALVYFNKAYTITQARFPQHTLIGSIRDNIADVYINTHQLKRAKPLYKANFEFYAYAKDENMGIKDITRLISAGSQFVETSLRLGHLEDAKTAFQGLETIMDTSKTIPVLPSSKLEFLKAQELLYATQNNISAAYNTLKYIEVLSDSLIAVEAEVDEEWRNELNNITLDRVALNFEINRIRNENKIKSQRSKLWISTLASSLVLILLLFLFLRRHQHFINAKNKQLLAEQALENTDLKVKQLHLDIKSKERDLSDFAISLTENQKWAELLASKVGAVTAAHPKDREVLLLDLKQEIKNKITFDSDTKVFFERLDKLSDSFYSELTKSFPNLSKNEIRLCSLIRLKIDNRHLASLQNITLASLNTSRYRLRKKLNLPETVDLDQFIQNL
ncbi:hypothetical protein QLS71_016035 [Mariniflexile litorale]|uniref:Tetratricopeptide repeat protein n=1 Tax=Mariniflexile litorale TaxID=3045158 RepID=A0AAU7EG14_9FLAO|nr:hypothetical protein [Mariniflexile sp. KMM 9835]MDQ8212345.1 hypothetical protein [Mariniflexile sp. KMM 9835]